MGIVWPGSDDKDKHGHPCLVERDSEHCRLKEHPETVLIIGDSLLKECEVVAIKCELFI